MSNFMNISEAASIALHSMVYIAGGKDITTVGDIASSLGVSENHLSKVMQRLAKGGLVKSVRGPKGGFVLGDRGDKVSLIEIYEAIEGPIGNSECLFKSHACGGDKCILGDSLVRMGDIFRKQLSNTMLSDLKDVFY